MLNGLYGLIFGSEQTEDSTQKVICQENVAVLNNEQVLVTPRKQKQLEEDWILVEDRSSGRSSPVLVPNVELDSISSTSSLSTLRTSLPCSPSQPRRADEMRHAKVAMAQRCRLEQKLFEEPCLLRQANKGDDLRARNVTTHLTASKLKRSSAAGHVASENKTKPRSKKSNKLQSGRNNDRKVNNLN